MSTTKKRTLSLLNQGKHWYGAPSNMREEPQSMLLEAGDAVLREPAIAQAIFAVL